MLQRKVSVPLSAPNGADGGNDDDQLNGGAEGGGRLQIPYGGLPVGKLELPELPPTTSLETIKARARQINEAATHIGTWLPGILARQQGREADIEELRREDASGTAVEIFLGAEQQPGTPEADAAQKLAAALEQVDHLLFEEQVVQWRRAAWLAYTTFFLGQEFNSRDEVSTALGHLTQKKLLVTCDDGMGPIKAYNIAYKPADSCIKEEQTAAVQKKLAEVTAGVGKRRWDEVRQQTQILLLKGTLAAGQLMAGEPGRFAFAILPTGPHSRTEGAAVVESDGTVLRVAVDVEGEGEEAREILLATGKHENVLAEAERLRTYLSLRDLTGSKPPFLAVPNILSWLRFAGKRPGAAPHNWEEKAEGLRQQSNLSVIGLLNYEPGQVLLTLPWAKSPEGQKIASGAVLLRSKDGILTVLDAAGAVESFAVQIREEGTYLPLDAVDKDGPPFNRHDSEKQRLANLLWCIVRSGLFDLQRKRVQTLWHLCRPAVMAGLQEEEEEGLKAQWKAEPGLLTSHQFLVQKKQGCAVISYDGHRPWHDEAGQRDIRNLFFRMERKWYPDKGYFLVLLGVPPHIPSDFLGRLIGQEFEEGDRFEKVPVPWRWILQAAYGQAEKAGDAAGQPEPAAVTSASGETPPDSAK